MARYLDRAAVFLACAPVRLNYARNIEHWRQLDDGQIDFQYGDADRRLTVEMTISQHLTPLMSSSQAFQPAIW